MWNIGRASYRWASRVDVVLLRGDRSCALGVPDFHHVWRTLGANAIVCEDFLGGGDDFLTRKYQRFAVAVVQLKHHELILQIAQHGNQMLQAADLRPVD